MHMSMQCILNNMYHKLKSILTDLGRYKECWLNMLTYLTLMSIVDTQIFFLVQFSFALYLFHLPLKGLSMIFNSCLSPDSFKSLCLSVCLSLTQSVVCGLSFPPLLVTFSFTSTLGQSVSFHLLHIAMSLKFVCFQVLFQLTSFTLFCTSPFQTISLLYRSCDFNGGESEDGRLVGFRFV